MERRKRAIILLITLLLSTQTVSAGPAEAVEAGVVFGGQSTEANTCLLYTSPSPRDRQKSRMPSSA